MKATTINRDFSPEVRKALENAPQEEIEALLRESFPEFFGVENTPAKRKAVIDSLLEMKPSKPKRDIDEVLNEVRQRTKL
jgi:hypothetical protein